MKIVKKHSLKGGMLSRTPSLAPSLRPVGMPTRAPPPSSYQYFQPDATENITLGVAVGGTIGVLCLIYVLLGIRRIRHNRIRQEQIPNEDQAVQQVLGEQGVNPVAIANIIDNEPPIAELAQPNYVEMVNNIPLNRIPQVMTSILRIIRSRINPHINDVFGVDLPEEPTGNQVAPAPIAVPVIMNNGGSIRFKKHKKVYYIK